jgi:adenylate cyclase
VAEQQIMDAKSFFRELRRRNVHKVALVYAVISWLLVEATSLLLFGHEERSSAMTVLGVIVLLGFVVALYISWAFEATPEGMKRTKDIPVGAVLPTWSRRKFTVFIVAVATLAASLFVFDVVRSRSKAASSPPTVAP